MDKLPELPKITMSPIEGQRYRLVGLLNSNLREQRPELARLKLSARLKGQRIVHLICNGHEPVSVTTQLLGLASLGGISPDNALTRAVVVTIGDNPPLVRFDKPQILSKAAASQALTEACEHAGCKEGASCALLRAKESVRAARSRRSQYNQAKKL